MIHRLRLLVALSALLLPACTLITKYDGYHLADSGVRDSGMRDGSMRDSGPIVCVPSCSGALECCSGVCVDTANNVENCGSCGAPCEGGDRAARICANSTCDLRCDPGFEDCNSGSGCETDLGTVANCGGCGVQCPVVCRADATGTTFMCADSCLLGQTNCSGSCADTTISVSHCGQCNRACVPRANAQASCLASNCSYTCNSPNIDCNGDLLLPVSDGCESVGQGVFPDADGDGYGDRNVTAAVIMCPGAAGFVTNNGDCDDNNDAVAPARLELCDGIDNDCNDAIDEGLSGNPCFCTTGSVAGTSVCDLDDPTRTCVYPAESCNFVDDDCDGFADQTLAAGPFNGYGPGGAFIPSRTEIIWVPSRQMGLATWFDDVSFSFRAAQFDATGAMLWTNQVGLGGGGPQQQVSVVPGWDGVSWMVFYVECPLDCPLLFDRFSPIDGIKLEQGSDAGVGAPRAFAAAQGDDGFALVFEERIGVDYNLVARFVSSTGISPPFVVVPDLMYTGTTGTMPKPAVVHRGSNRFTVFGPSEDGAVYAQNISFPNTLEFTTPTRIDLALSGTIPRALDAAFDPSNTIALVFTTGTAMAFITMLDGAAAWTPRIPAPRMLPSTPRPRVAAGGDGSVVVTVQIDPPMAQRFRMSDGQSYPAAGLPPFAGLAGDVTDMSGSANRFIAIVSSSGMAQIGTQVITCR